MMDYLDESTVEVAQPSKDPDAVSQSRQLPLEGAAPLKNQTQNLVDLNNFAHHDNPLFNAGSELLSLCVCISRMPQPDDIHSFRQGLKSAITDLKQRIASLDYPPSVGDKTCFLFCIVLDELILHSDWGENSGWENQTLVSDLFGMRNGGEQFYQVAEKALAQPNLLLDLLELIYIFIKIGFRGQYRLSGREVVDSLLQRIETVVFRSRPQVSFQADIRVTLPKLHRPSRQSRFGRQLLLFVCGVALVWGATSYWYQNSFEQRARDFLTLPEFSKTYLSSNEDREAVYISTVDEINLAASAFSDTRSGRTPSAYRVSQPSWLVQLATLDSREQGDKFIEYYQLQTEGARVETWRNRYRVLIPSDSRVEASQLVELLRTKGVTDAFIFSNRQGR